MNLMELFVKIGVDKSDFDKGLDSASGKAASFASKLGGGLKTAAKVGTAAITAASSAVTAFGVASVKAGATFDSSMSQVAATMGKTVDEIQDLRDFAQEMGSKTAFSASQAADALNYMALAGYDAETSMSVLPSVLNLASAGGIDLAYASDMVTDSLSALGLESDDAADLVDKMAKASSKSNTSVSQLGEAILTVGGTAKTLAGGTTELSTALGILADNGIKGAEGGTALRNIILSLSAPTDKAAKKMLELGLSAYDADGNLRPMQDIFEDLNGVLSGMTQGEQTDVLNTLFNKVDLKSANALLATSSERWEELSESIDNASGAAQQMADTQLDNLAGDITLFKSALEGAQIAISDQLTPTLREFVQFGSSGLSKITDAFKEGGLSGAMDAFGDILSDGLTMIIDKLPTIIDAGTKLLEALIGGILDNSDKLIDASVKIIEILGNAIITNLPKLIMAGFEILSKLGESLVENLPTLIPAIVEVLLQIVEMIIDNLDEIIDAGIKITLALLEGIMNALPKLIMELPKIIVALTRALVEAIPKMNMLGLQLIGGLIEGIGNALPAIGVAIYNLVTSILDWFKDLLGIHSPSTVFAGFGEDLIQGLINGIKSLMVSLGKTALAVVDKITSTFDGMPKKFMEIGGDIVTGLWNGLKNGWNWLTDKVKDLASNLLQGAKDALGIASPSKEFAWVGKMVDEGFALGIEQNEHLPVEQAKKSFSFADDLVTDVKNDAVQARPSANGASDIESIVRGVLSEMSFVVPVYIGGDKVDEKIVMAGNDYNFRSGGR